MLPSHSASGRPKEHSLQPRPAGAARPTEQEPTDECSHWDSTAEKPVLPEVSRRSASYRTRSHAWQSVKSSVSSAGSAAVRARARAEAAKARLGYAAEEANLKLQQAKLEVTMDVLKHKKEAAAAIAEAEVLEAAVDAISETHSRDLKADSVPLVASQRTEQYVVDQLKERESEINSYKNRVTTAKMALTPGDNMLPSELKPDSRPFYPHQDRAAPNHLVSQQYNISAYEDFCQPLIGVHEDVHTPHGILAGEHATPVHHFISQPDNTQPSPACHAVPSGSNDSGSHMNDFVRYLARRELVATGLLQFNDKAQNYRAWKRSFRSAITGLNLTPSEELDLLLKWLGKESAEHVEQIRAIHIHRPEAGLAMAWERLELTYGSPEAIENALFKRIDSFPKIVNRDGFKLTKLGDLLMELQAAKAEGDLPGLAFLDTPRGVNPVVLKLPFRLQEKWVLAGTAYKRQYQVNYPPFAFFVDFVNQQARIANDPGFSFIANTDTALRAERATWKSNRQREIAVHKTEVSHSDASDTGEPPTQSDDWDKLCLLHKKPHPLRKCRAFRGKPIDERRILLKENNVCFKCLSSSSHMAKNCKIHVQCMECKSDRHSTALHPGPAPWQRQTGPVSEHGGEEGEALLQSHVTNKCTKVCGGELTDRSCSKICLVKVFPASNRRKAVKLYAILDEQSNRSLVHPQFFDIFNDQSPSAPYTLRTCAGVKQSAGRRASGYEVESLDGTVRIPLPSLIECDDIPNNREEIPTPEVALHHAHLRSVARFIPDIDPQAPIMLLLGRDIIRVHKVREQVNGSHNLPYAQKLDLGWVIVGNVCLGKVHRPLTISTFHTNTIELQRPTLFDACPNVFHVKEKFSSIQVTSQVPAYREDQPVCEADHLGCTVFRRTKDDNRVAPSIQDATFMKIMDEGMGKDSNNSWVAPLPFKSPRPRLPDNRPLALKRLMSLKRNIEKKPEMRDHFLTFMHNMLQKGHAELAPPLSIDEERWYLPTFGVYHPKKPKKIRVVFDSSAQYNGISLNDVLLTGPDLNNTLLGVLIRFRREASAFTADIEQMFYCFWVREEDRNFLRFLWFQDNDISKAIVDYRMNVHVFGNSPSPAVAIHGLHKSVQGSKFDVDPDVQHFVMRDFYVDDGLKSLPTVAAAVNLLKMTQEVLSKSNLRLHKIAANSKEVMDAFPPSDHASDLKDLNLDADTLPLQRSLGINWDLQTDCFLFSIASETKAYTRRGVLSTINSLYDPLGFVAPVTVQGKAILRELTAENGDWDAPLPQLMQDAWASWRASLSVLTELSIPRRYTEASPSAAVRRELCVFCDASVMHQSRL